jgi:hypothetical protein
MEVPETITCVECGGAAPRLTPVPAEDGFLPDDVVAYLCPECGQRFDLVLEEDAEDDSGA